MKGGERKRGSGRSDGGEPRSKGLEVTVQILDFALIEMAATDGSTRGLMWSGLCSKRIPLATVWRVVCRGAKTEQ